MSSHNNDHKFAFAGKNVNFFVKFFFVGNFDEQSHLH